MPTRVKGCPLTRTVFPSTSSRPPKRCRQSGSLMTRAGPAPDASSPRPGADRGGPASRAARRTRRTRAGRRRPRRSTGLPDRELATHEGFEPGQGVAAVSVLAEARAREPGESLQGASPRVTWRFTRPRVSTPGRGRRVRASMTPKKPVVTPIARARVATTARLWAGCRARARAARRSSLMGGGRSNRRAHEGNPANSRMRKGQGRSYASSRCAATDVRRRTDATTSPETRRPRPGR